MAELPPTAIVTGAAGGLGQAFAVRLARDGWRVAVADLDPAKCDETLRLIASAGGTGRAERLDVTRPAEWEALVARLRGEWDRLDLLVNNAGVAASGEIGEGTLDDWRWLVDVNLLGCVNGCHACVGWLKENPRGAAIINVASLAAIACAPAMPAYNTTKAAVVALSETLYMELRKDRVHVTAVCPDFFATNLLSSGHLVTDSQRKQAEKWTRKSSLTAEYVADRAVRGARRRKLYVVLGAKARWIWRLRRWAPGFYTRLLAAIYAHWHKRRLARQQAREAAAAAEKP